MAVTLQLIYRSTQLIKIKAFSLQKLTRHGNPNIHMEIQEPNNFDEGLIELEMHTSQFHSLIRHYRNSGSVILEKGQIDQWNIIESAEVSTYIHGQAILDKGTQTIQWEILVF